MLSFVVMLSASSEEMLAKASRYATATTAHQAVAAVEPDSASLAQLVESESVRELEAREMADAQKDLDLANRNLARDEPKIIKQLVAARKVFWEMQSQLAESEKTRKLLTEQEKKLESYRTKLADLERDHTALSRELDSANRASETANARLAAARKEGKEYSGESISSIQRDVDSKAESARDALDAFNQNEADMRKVKAQKVKLSASVKELTAKVKTMRESDAVRVRTESLEAFSRKIDKLYSDLQSAQMAVLQAKINVALGYSAKAYIENFGAHEGEDDVEEY